MIKYFNLKYLNIYTLKIDFKFQIPACWQGRQAGWDPINNVRISNWIPIFMGMTGRIMGMTKRDLGMTKETKE